MGYETIKLEQPLFYNNPFGLRFEIGPTDIEIWTDFDRGTLNSEYFEIATERAIRIFNAVFASTDNLSIAYQMFSDGRQKIRKSHYLFKQISKLDHRKIVFTKHRDLYTEDLYQKRHCFRRVTISNIKVKDVNTQGILRALVNMDFSLRRRPSMYGQCFFINHDKGIVLNLYDDRGMDVVSLEKEALIGLYKSHHTYLLDRNRQQMKLTFS